MRRAPAEDGIPDVLFSGDDEGEQEQHGRRVSAGQTVYEIIVIPELDLLNVEYQSH